MTYLLLKYIHIISSTFLYGAGAGTALLIVRAYANRKRNAGGTLRFALEHAVLVDWFFTLGAGIVQLVTGVMMAFMAGFSFTGGWVFVSLVLFFVIFILWAFAAWLQLKMKKILSDAEESDPPELSRLYKMWLLPGILAFILMNLIFLLMVFKRLP